MKKLLPILLTVMFIYSCKKSNSDNGNRSTALKSIVVYNPTSSLYRTQNIQSFTYGSNGQLLSYTEKTIDSSFFNGTIGVDFETRVFTLNYSADNRPPDSYSLLDSEYNHGDNYLMVLNDFMGFVYDSQNRLTADTPSTPNSTSELYAYSGDTVFCMEVVPGSPQPTGRLLMLVTENGNVVSNYSIDYTYSSFANPLENTSIARTYVANFYGGLIGLSTSYGLPLDFISRNLPSSYKDNSGNIAQFNWTTDSRGRVTGGTATNLFPYDQSINGTIYITFNYE